MVLTGKKWLNVKFLKKPFAFIFLWIIQIGSRERVSNTGCRSQLFARGVTDRSM